MKIQILYLITSLMLLGACKKDKLLPPTEHSTSAVARILLHDNYLPASRIDSAFVEWTVGGLTISKKLELYEPFMQARLDGIPTGEGKLVFRIFSKNKLNNLSLMYDRLLQAQLHTGNIYTVTAPNFLEDVNWKPRVIFNSRQSSSFFKITAFVGIRPDDAYFQLYNIDSAWRHRILLERTYYHTSNMSLKLADGRWDCLNNNCIDDNGNYTNTNFFSFLPQQLNNRPWNRVEILLRFYNTPISAAELNFNYNF